MTGYADGIQTSLSKLFVWGTAGGSGDLFAVGDLPQTGPLPSSAPSLQLGNYSTPISCSNPAVYGDKAYKYCTVQQTHGTEFELYSWDGSKALDPIQMSELPIKDLFTAATSGVFGDSTNSYLLVQSGALSLKALALTGASAGSVLDVPNNITVPDNIGFSFNSSTTGGITLSGIVKIVGITFGLLFVCGCVIGLRRRKAVVVEKRRVYVPALIPVDV